MYTRDKTITNSYQRTEFKEITDSTLIKGEMVSYKRTVPVVVNVVEG